jgi:hypothetical protein
MLEETLRQEVTAAWETDGLRVLEPTWSSDKIQILFSTEPSVSPVFLATRAKGRLDYAYRRAGRPCEFRRKLAVRSVGDNVRVAVEQYIANQVSHSEHVDPRYRRSLEELTVSDPSVDLSAPTKTNSGQ